MAVVKTADYSNHPKQNLVLSHLKIKLAWFLNRASFAIAITIKPNLIIMQGLIVN